MCSITKGDLPLKIWWTFKPDNENEFSYNLTTGDGIMITRPSSKISMIAIENVKSRHRGTYQCFASNLAATVFHSAFLSINVAPQIVPFSFGEEEFNLDDSVSATCSVTKGDLPLKIWWTFKSDDPNEFAYNLTTGDGIVITKPSSKISMIAIEALKPRHRGTFTCFCQNRASSVNSSAYLSINVIPVIAPFSFSEEELNLDESVSATCTVTKGDLPIKIWWNFKPDNEIEFPYNLTTGDGVLITRPNAKNSFLSIENVKSRHRGTYECRAINAAGQSVHSAFLSINVIPQIMPFTFGDEELNFDDSVTATCSVTKGDQPLKIWWTFKPDNENEFAYNLTTGDGIMITKPSPKISMLAIEALKPRHRGTFTCVVENKAATSTHSAFLSINVIPQIMPFTFGDEELNLDDSVSAICSITKGDLPIKIWWTFKSVDDNEYPYNLTTGDGILITRPSAKISMIAIEALKPRHRGTYSCFAQNVGGFSNYSTHLSLNVIPQIMPFSFGDEELNLDDSVSAMCSIIKGDLPLKIWWTFKPDNENEFPYNLTTGDGIVITKPSAKMSVLGIENVKSRHRGTYQCFASNHAATVSHSAFLSINVVPQIVPFSFGEEEFNLDDSVTATCSVTKGDLPIKIWWTFKPEGDDSTAYNLTSNDGIMITKPNSKTSFLGIESVKSRHRGTYECVASNRAATVSHSTFLSINVAPQIVPFSFGEEEFNLDDSVSTVCSITKGDLPLKIWWTFKPDNENEFPYNLTTGDGIVITRNSAKMSVLGIESVKSRHRGTFSCYASNKANSTVSSAFLSINVIPQIVPFSFGEDEFNLDDSVSTICSITKGDLPLKIWWTFKPDDSNEYERNLTTGDGIMITRPNAKNSFLSIESVKSRHRGSYSCFCENKAAAVNFTTHLSINVLPHVVPFSFGEEEFNLDDSVMASCSVTKGDMPLKFFWTFKSDDNEFAYNLTTGDGVMITRPNAKISMIAIEALKPRHRGTYTCVVSNLATNLSDKLVNQSAYLSINVLPVIMPFSFGDEELNLDDSVNAVCSITKGDLPVKIYWMFKSHDDEFPYNLTTDDGIVITRNNQKVSMLSIEKLKPKHKGNYSCVAKNAAGTVMHSSYLSINGLNFDFF
ncbi:hypothetical protein PVAND_015702 [Polypedilum vanderplanki]|uniref:Ig-like domain-containing protein n=1 Tax=Polypedilum vanderplanki TaxID=319348 RepID=A0A9J6BDY1_POLVA|nr:hypothetical protein PVAND_015702 [Polypedilum vanderplanki]